MIEISDYELLMLYHENNNDAEKILYNRYQKIIKIILKKYQHILIKININHNDLFIDCLSVLSEAFNSYSLLYNSSFYTYAYLLIDRFIKKEIIKYNRPKNRYVYNTYSLDYTYQDLKLEEIIKDVRKTDPLETLEIAENIELINSLAQKILSKFEYKLYCFLLKGFSNKDIGTILNKSEKQIANTIYRIRSKLKAQLI